MRKWILLISVALLGAGVAPALAQNPPVRSAAALLQIAQAVINEAVAKRADITQAVAAAVEADPDLAAAFAQIANANPQLAAAINAGLDRAFALLSPGTGFQSAGNGSPYIPYVSNGGFGGGPVSPH